MEDDKKTPRPRPSASAARPGSRTSKASTRAVSPSVSNPAPARTPAVAPSTASSSKAKTNQSPVNLTERIDFWSAWRDKPNKFKAAKKLITPGVADQMKPEEVKILIRSLDSELRIHRAGLNFARGSEESVPPYATALSYYLGRQLKRIDPQHDHPELWGLALSKPEMEKLKLARPPEPTKDVANFSLPGRPPPLRPEEFRPLKSPGTGSASAAGKSSNPADDKPKGRDKAATGSSKKGKSGGKPAADSEQPSKPAAQPKDEAKPREQKPFPNFKKLTDQPAAEGSNRVQVIKRKVTVPADSPLAASSGSKRKASTNAETSPAKKIKEEKVKAPARQETPSIEYVSESEVKASKKPIVLITTEPPQTAKASTSKPAPRDPHEDVTIDEVPSLRYIVPDYSHRMILRNLGINPSPPTIKKSKEEFNIPSKELFRKFLTGYPHPARRLDLPIDPETGLFALSSDGFVSTMELFQAQYGPRCIRCIHNGSECRVVGFPSECTACASQKSKKDCTFLATGEELSLMGTELKEWVFMTRPEWHDLNEDVNQASATVFAIQNSLEAAYVQLRRKMFKMLHAILVTRGQVNFDDFVARFDGETYEEKQKHMELMLRIAMTQGLHAGSDINEVRAWQFFPMALLDEADIPIFDTAYNFYKAYDANERAAPLGFFLIPSDPDDVRPPQWVEVEPEDCFHLLFDEEGVGSAEGATGERGVMQIDFGGDNGVNGVAREPQINRNLKIVSSDFEYKLTSTMTLSPKCVITLLDA
ncbi:hypothetical protein R3P38DRAFT_3240472 [Favolaschia claudopus]|uniref:Uncharacterized protein n=1 Tax=Favolaschia claudopus TaxID=2862362 RepID=A0AAV9Z6A1_9AGAR